MSSHSRSSSELETVPYADVLPVFVKDFIKDFSFSDVQYYVKDLFTTEEYTAIVQQKNEKSQILQLFWVLCARESIIPKFLEVIRDSYDWLVDKVMQERNNLSKDTEQYIEALKELRSRNQQHTDYNVHRIEYFNQLRNALRELKPYHYVVLYGDLGKGKRWLALDVCSEYTVMRRMDFKIYWIDVSECTSQEHDLRQLQHFRLLLGDSNCATLSPTTTSTISISNRILDLQQDLKLKLHSDKFKNCLLVLLNVQNVKTWRAFNLGCKMLITTRNKKVSESLSDKMSRVISIDKGLTLNEFQSLFEKYLACKRHQFPPNANDIYDYSTGNPYLLSIIAKNIRRKKYDWNQWIGQLKNLEITDNKFNKVIEISLNVLTTELMELYATFAIFPHSIVIPVKLLATLWNKTMHEAEIIVQKFHKYSIVNKTVQDDGTQVCSLPFIYSTYLKTATKIQGDIKSMELHRKVIDYYSIEKTFQNRTEIDLCTLQHDLYFFSYIGYHLQEAGCTQLFQQLYLDFGFLGQKIRAVGLLNTLGDLKYYEKEISDLDPRIKELLYSIRKFLPQVEEKLMHTKDTCLLQYALMASGDVQVEAKKQIRQFPDKVWFYENGSFHQRRQIVNIPGQPKLVNFLMQDNCLLVLDNNNMLLVDISLDCNNAPVLLINDELQNCIVQAQLFRNGDFILTLNEHGELKLWFIGDMRRRHSTSGPSKHKFQVNPLSFNWKAKMVTRKSQQSIHEYNMKRGKIVAFHIEQEPARYGNNTLLHIAYDTGDVCALKWNAETQEFQSEMHLIPLHTGETSIRFLYKIHSKFYMILNKAGNISFWNLRDTSKMPLSFDWPQQHSTLLSCEVYEDPKSLKTCILYIFADRILRLTVAEKSEPVLQGNLELLYSSGNCITCAKLSHDKQYLVIGSKLGLIVFDMNACCEILRGNVSEAIACVDIYDLDDPIYKYVIICGCRNKKVLNILALIKTDRGSIGWSHNVASQNGSEKSCNEPQLEPDVWLLGHKLYDMYTDEDGTWLLAADSKNRIHHVNTYTRKWLLMPTDTSQSVTAITVNKHYAFAGYKNGAIFDLSHEVLEAHFTNQPIAYLKLLDDRFLVASTKPIGVTSTSSDTVLTRVSDLAQKVEKIYKIDTKVCFRLFKQYILLVNENGIVLLHDIRGDFEVLDDLKNFEMGTVYLAGCDYKNGILFLATTKYSIYGYQFTEVNGELKREFKIFKNNAVQNIVTCLTASNDASLLAIGLDNGDIDVYKVAENYELNNLYCCQSHTVAIQDMKFSPHNDVLVSCAEQLCFWNVSYMLNNPLITNTAKRRSSRFSSQRSEDVDGVDADIGPRNLLQVQGSPESSVATEKRNSGDLTDALKELHMLQRPSAWVGKIGPDEKRELLACIKFDGNSAEKIFTNADFTQFNTIDDAGVYYHLSLLHDANEAEGQLPTTPLRMQQQIYDSHRLEFNYSSSPETYTTPTGGGDVVDWPTARAECDVSIAT